MFIKLRPIINAFAMCLSIGLYLFVPPDVSAEFQPNETQISSENDLIDPEYDQGTSQFTWADSAGNLWIGKLDDDGMFNPPSGKAILVDTKALTTVDLVDITMNGPEWLQTADGPKIVYTKFLPASPHTADNARLAFAQLGPDGNWTYRFLAPRLSRNAPYCSHDIGDIAPRITYVDSNLNHYWREVSKPTTERLIPLIEPSKKAVRWVKDIHAVIFSATSPYDNSSQVFKYDVDTKVLDQMTFDYGNKGTNSPWMWQAPEYDNEYILFATAVNANQSTELRIYRQVDSNNNGKLVWTKIFTAVAPSNGRIGSPEPFTYNGHSYIFMQMSFGDQSPTSIWLANIDPANPFFRKISDDTLFRWRTDPEVFITSKGPYIYYNRKNPYDPRCNSLYCTEGIFRAYTGLSPD